MDKNMDKHMFKTNTITWEQAVTWPFYFDNYEQVSAHWENGIPQEKWIPSLISSENIFNKLENNLIGKQIFSIESSK